MKKDKCQCMNMSDIADLKLALIVARDTYNNRAKKLIGEESAYPKSEMIIEKAKKFHLLINELGKINVC